MIIQDSLPFNITKPITNSKLLTMKRIFLLLLVCTLASLAGYAQQYPITGITISLPSNPPANTANWGTGASTIVITAQTRLVQAQIDGHVAESQVLVTIEKGGSKVCGSYTSATAPMSGFSSAVKTYAGSNAMALLAQDCTLPPGDYQLCVQFFGNDSTGGFGAFSEKKCKLFSIRGNEQPPEVLKYTGPTLVSPVNGTVFKCEDLKKPLSLRWTPVVPPPHH